MDNIKFFEIRDEATCIPVMAIALGALKCYNSRELAIIRRGGYSVTWTTIVLMRLSDCEANYDIYNWTYGRTLRVAHNYINENWDNLKSGALIDVRVILGEEIIPAETDLSC